ncbi:RagB/SusD family nutrient uptake outer membrane protein [Pedobacter sp. ASV1-7]|jgi:hypothetical protein|uniref:RagB/SusD family nutrient uptake outer membrane protein n=1 Tax=Pedobacter sp. ASV1-7 TaxID=3145237 RepID=UPI0032E92B04
MNKFTLIFITVYIFLVGCQKPLELTPYDFLSPTEYYENKTQINNALTGVYSTLKDNALYANNMLGRMGLDADEAYNRNSNDANSIGDYAVSTADIKVLSFWRVLYAGINRANSLLANINKPKDLTDSERATIEGETLFLRSYFYFLLVSNFGDVPLILQPINTADSKSHQIERMSKVIVYEAIVADLEKASDLVQPIDKVGYGGRVSQSAVWAMLARVNLHMAGKQINDHSRYEEVKKWARKVMELPIHRLNPSFKDVFVKLATDKYDIGESILEVEFYGNGTGIYAGLSGYVGVQNGIYNQTDIDKGFGYSYINTTNYTYDVYASGDLRRDWTIAPFYYAFPNNEKKAVEVQWATNQIMNRNCGKFRRDSETLLPKHKSFTPQNFPLIRLSDVMLMFAEADNEINNGATPEGYEAINKVRRRGFGLDYNIPNVTVDLKNLSKSVFLERMQEERTRELAFECLRKGDLVRWGIFLTNMKQRLSEANSHIDFYDLRFAKNMFRNVSARDIVWPIPSYELGVNFKLIQNAGW